MVRHKLVRADGTTEVTEIKSFHFREQKTNDGVVRFGNAISSFIEVSYFFDNNSEKIPKGEELTYYQVFDTNQEFIPFSEVDWEDEEDPPTEFERQIGVFVVKDVEENKNVYTLVAYDYVSKLDVNYSPRLKELQSSFPQNTVYLLHDVADYVGVTTNIGSGSQLNILHYGKLKAFYVDNITARDIFRWAAEMLGVDIVARYDGVITTSNYGDTPVYRDGIITRYDTDYVISPTDQVEYYTPDPEFPSKLISAFYKQDGLSVMNVNQNNVDCVKFIGSDGTIIASYSESGSEDYVYTVYANLLLDNITNRSEYQDAVTGTAQNVFENIQRIQKNKNIMAKLFPFRCYYRSGGMTYLVDNDGTVIEIPIMSVDWTDEAVVVETYGKIELDTNINDADSQTTSLGVSLNELIGRVNSLVSTKSFNVDSISINANGYQDITIGVTRDGYTPIGIVGMRVTNASTSGSNSSKITIPNFRISGNNALVRLGNFGSSAANVRCYVYVLYILSS